MSNPAESRASAPSASSASPQPSPASSSTLHSRRSRSPALYPDSPGLENGSFESPGPDSSPSIGNDGASTTWDNSPQSSPLGGSSRTNVASSRPHSHGGFLLDTALAPGRRTRPWPREGRYDLLDTKGKRRRLGADDGRAKMRNQPPRHFPSSPLATHSANATSDYGGTGNGGDEASSPIASRHNSPRQRLNNNGPSIRFQDVRQRDEGTPSIGLNTDPAQIVSLALNLSEGRRRTASAGRQPSISNRRISSIGQSQPPMDLPGFSYAEGPGGALREHLRQQRRISYNVPSTARKISTALGVGSPLGRGPTGDIGGSGEVDTFLLDPNFRYQFSASTLARAEKARNFFELAHEYRRLLQCLPPIKPQLPRGSKGTGSPNAQESLSRATTRSNDWHELGREYNPLQCIRNRKVRARERMSVDLDAQGWTDPDKVADWVDEIEAESGKGELAYGDGALFPPYGPGGPVQIGRDENAPSQSGVHRRGASTHVKPRRPRMDWSINPAENLADAFWLEQAGHRALIEDKDGFKLFPGASRPKPMSSHAPAYPPYNPSPNEVNASPAHEKIAMHPMNTQYGEGGIEFVREQLRLEKQLQNQSRGRSAESGSRKHRYRRQAREITPSVSPSSSESSDDEKARGIRGRLGRARRSRDEIESEAIEKRMLQMLEKDAKETGIEDFLASPRSGKGQGTALHNSSQQHLQLPNSHPDSVVEPNGLESRRQSHTTLSSHASTNQNQNGGSVQSLHDPDEVAPRTSFAEGSIPDIGVNGSAPASRAGSPIRKLFSAASSKGRKMEGYPISENDFAMEEGDDDVDFQDPTAVGPTRTLSHRDSAELGPRESMDSLRRGKRLKKEKENDAKGRGFFKGGKLEALLKREAARVGDIFWRKDEPSNAPIESSRSSIEADMSNTESDASFPVAKKPRTRDGDQRGKDDSPSLSRKTTIEPPPKYHMDNLPTFTSRRAPQSSIPEIRTPVEDRQAERNQLDPQKRDEPAQRSTQDISRQLSQEPVGSKTDLEDSSRFTSRTDLERMETPQNLTGGDTLINAALGLPGRVFRAYGPPVTGLASLGVTQDNKASHRPRLEGMRHWSIADRELPPVQTAVTRQEIARVRALLLCSGVKAKEINRRAKEVRSPEDSLVSLVKQPVHGVPRVDEHMVAAHFISKEFDAGVQRFHEDVKRLSDSRIANLHERLAVLQDRIEGKLTPIVQGLADEADYLNTELTTTRTLSLKQLNDSLGFVIRNRRGTLRWARKLGFLILEWTLLTLMWCVWFIVVVVRWVRKILHAIMAVIRWLLWM
ncbi:hypothetical protein L228DRAFT_242685 [Xylona heveae TC161]|uniref:Uncharacterized protein n=1 Tax=Xylona heveae (strain CBS 132557 / TC161) TaxID=1328760 RepID=A0A165JHE7_XYLHT|nr:hypothetical protein L228DRAFT_242685 [Xylona heveae TC161]KZF26245.1 hypothetical protein L228DRAFT_242685 [Xylona heveae TC161]